VNSDYPSLCGFHCMHGILNTLWHPKEYDNSTSSKWTSQQLSRSWVCMLVLWQFWVSNWQSIFWSWRCGRFNVIQSSMQTANNCTVNDPQGVSTERQGERSSETCNRRALLSNNSHGSCIISVISAGRGGGKGTRGWTRAASTRTSKSVSGYHSPLSSMCGESMTLT